MDNDATAETRTSQDERRPRRLNLPADDCVFCAIVSGTEEASIVHADDDVVAFLDLCPVNDGHLLVVPRLHVAGLAGHDFILGAAMRQVAHRLAGSLYAAGLRCEDVNLCLADGAAAFQEVFHVHLHVIPRFTGDDFRVDAGWRRRERAELDRHATMIREAAWVTLARDGR